MNEKEEREFDEKLMTDRFPSAPWARLFPYVGSNCRMRIRGREVTGRICHVIGARIPLDLGGSTVEYANYQDIEILDVLTKGN